jgi:hypothetical protein
MIERILIGAAGLPARHRVGAGGAYRGSLAGLRRTYRVVDSLAPHAPPEFETEDEPPAPPPGEILVDAAPADARMIWTGAAWALPEEAARADLVAATKAEAGRRILAILPEFKQRNLLARGLELHAKGPATWSEAEQAEWAAGNSLWARIKAIRARCDALEAAIAAMDQAARAAFDPAAASWPE